MRLLLVLGVLAAAPAPSPALGDEKPAPRAERVAPEAGATFAEHVFPILKEHCLGCHGGERPKGRLSMESLETLERGGKKGPPVVAGKPEESLLYQVLSGARKPSMPPEGEEPLEERELGTIRVWIAGGAKPGQAAAPRLPYSDRLEPVAYQRPPAVTALAYSADGGLLFASGYREVLVHDAAAAGASEAGSLRARLLGEADRILALALSSDGKLLAAAGGNPGRFGEVQIWEVPEGKLRRFFRVGRDTLFAAAFDPSGKSLAVGGTDRSLHLLDLETGNEVYASEVHADWIFGLAFSADGTRLASGSRDRTVKVSQAADGKFLQTLGTFAGPVLRVAARPGGASFLACGEEPVPVLYDMANLKELRRFEAQPGAILAAAWSGDGKLFAAGGAGSEVRVYQADDGARAATLGGSRDWIYALAFRPDGGRLATAGYEGLVRIYELPAGKEVASFVPVPLAPPPAAAAAAGSPAPPAGAAGSSSPR